MIRVLVADDSRVAREILVQVLRSDGSIEVVGETGDGQEAAFMAARLRPDVVTMDVHMPSLDGFGATQRIMQHISIPTVIISGEFDTGGSAFRRNVARSGACAVLPQLPSPDSPEFDSAAEELLRTIKALATAALHPGRASTEKAEVDRKDPPMGIAVVRSSHDLDETLAFLCMLPSDIEPLVVTNDSVGAAVRALESIADRFGPRSVAIIPEHTDTDLAQGLLAIRLAGGRVFALRDGREDSLSPVAAMNVTLADAFATPEMLLCELAQAAC